MQSHADGEGASRKRTTRPAKGKPIIGPIPPDPKTGAPRSHIKGSSWIRDMQTGEEYANTWDIKDRGDTLETNVGGHMGTDRFTVASKDKAVLDHYRKVREEAARAAYWERRVFNAVPIPKPGGGKQKTKATKTCPECEGSGMVWFGDEEEPCRRCQGEGNV